jgi:hypothetical protein
MNCEFSVIPKVRISLLRVKITYFNLHFALSGELTTFCARDFRTDSVN